MKRLKTAVAIILAGLVSALFLTLCYTQLILPIRIERALASGCASFNSVSYQKPLGAGEKLKLLKAFQHAAHLDSRYMNLVQAAGLVANKDASLGDLQSAATYNANILLIGYCFPS